jgi:tetratricopeptide (TPR) repeat protein
VLLHRGLVLNALNRPLEALASFESAIALDFDFIDAHNNRAVLLADLGRHDEALKSYREALLIEPRDARTHYNLGNLLKQLRRFDAALASFDAAIAEQPTFAEALCNRGAVLHEMSRLDESLDSFDRALTLRPDISEAHFNRGNVLHELRRSDEALHSYDCAIAVQPDYAEALCHRGVVLGDAKRFDEAIESLDRALTLRPDLAKAHLARGEILRELGRLDDALESCDQAVAAGADSAEAFNNRGLVLDKLGRHEEALENYDRALVLQPDNPVTLRNRGCALTGLDRFEEALATYDRIFALQSDCAEAHYNRGNTLLKMERFAEALASYDRALALRSELSDALNNRGIALTELKRFDEALASHRRAYASNPSDVEARWNEALLQLLLGEYSRGWAGYEWRWHKEPMIRARREFHQPMWRGEQTIERRTILVHGEQGLGDTIQFSRYVRALADKGAHVIFEVQPPLHRLMQGVSDAAQVVARGEPLPAFDCHCPLLSLPLALGTRLDTIPAERTYLHAPRPAMEAWQTRLQAHRRPRIGLVWSGNPDHKNDQNRSISLRTLLPLLTIDATFVSLQRDIRPADAAVLAERSDLLNLAEGLRDFADTAALVSQLDLIISVDTSVAHLAGALGKPIWILVTYLPDWRWLLDRDDSPWYPSARLFRQGETRNWEDVILRVREAAATFAASQRPNPAAWEHPELRPRNA